MYTVYSTTTCSYCKNTKNFLDGKGLPYKEVVITSQDIMDEVTNKLGYTPRTVPQIWKEEVYIGGYDDLVRSFKGDDIGA